MPPTLTQAHPPLPLGELGDLIGSFEAQSSDRKKAIVDRLVALHPLLNLKWGADWRYRRSRRLDAVDRPGTVDELIWPKHAPARIGRANPAGFQVLYLADRQDTALKEVEVEDHFSVVADFGIQAGREIHLAPIGEMILIHRTGLGSFGGPYPETVRQLLAACSRDEQRSLLITDAFLRHCLVGQDDYEISSHVALSAFRKVPEIKVIAYPSRKQFGAVCFAVRVEHFWEDWCLHSVRFGRAREVGMGFYKFEDAQVVVGIHGDGRLEWEAVADPEERAELAPAFVLDR